MRSVSSFAQALAGLALLLQPLQAASIDKRASSPTPYKVQKPPLDTDWTYKVGTNPWPEHPRPQLQRDQWQSLNGIWTYQGADNTAANPDRFDSLLGREVMVPSCIESGLSGIQDVGVTNLWYARYFKVDDSWKNKKILMNFEAVDYEATVYVNGDKVGSHTGGYFRFTMDVTKSIKFGQDNHL